jgi:hypothetical protein
VPTGKLREKGFANFMAYYAQQSLCLSRSKKKWRLCFADVSVPETRFLPEENLHHLNAGGVIYDREFYTVRAEEILGADAFVFTPGATLEVLFAN